MFFFLVNSTMVCKGRVFCMIAAALLMATLFAGYAVSMKTPSMVGPEVDRIKEERARIAAEGAALGLLAAVVLPFAMKEPTPCMSAAALLLVQYFYYSMAPKSDWVVHHLYTREQREKWTANYQNIKLFYHAGLIVGALGAAAAGVAFCPKKL